MSEEKAILYKISSDGGEKWSDAKEIPFLSSNDGCQLTVFKGKVWGAFTSTSKNQPKYLGVCKYSKTGGWTNEFLYDKKYRAEGRPSITALGDRLYILYRGTDNGVYLTYTTAGVNWTDLGRIGSKYAETHQAPAIYPVGKDKLLLAGVGADKLVYYTVTDKDGKREKSWTPLTSDSEAKTQGGLAITKFPLSTNKGDEDPKAILFRSSTRSTSYGSYNYYSFVDEEGPYDFWNHGAEYAYSYAGVSATPYKPDQLFVAFMDRGYRLHSQIVKADGEATNPKLIDENSAFLSEAGVAYLDGDLYVSYTLEPEQTSARRRNTYRSPTVMDEKKALAEADQWDCKWKKEDKVEDKKVDLQSLIRGCFCL